MMNPRPKNRLRAKLWRKGIFNAVFSIVRQFYRDGGIFMAASISYFALLSLIPLILTLINILAYFLGRSPDLRDAALNSVKVLYPMMGGTLAREISRVTAHSQLGWISLIVFLWLGSLVFGSLEYSINTIFKARKRRHPVTAAVLSCSMVLVSGTLMMVSFWVAYIPEFIESHPNIITSSPVVSFLARRVLLQAVSLVIMFFSFTALYKVLPNRKIKLRLAAQGGVAAAILWEAAKYAFAWYVGSFADLKNIYGSFTAIIMFLLWIFYSSTIMLLVAEMLYLSERGEIA